MAFEKKRRLLIYGAAIAFDAIDYLGIGFLPIAGDIVDVVAIPVMFYLTGSLYFFDNLIEVIPGADILPTNIVTAIALDVGWLK